MGLWTMKPVVIMQLYSIPCLLHCTPQASEGAKGNVRGNFSKFVGQEVRGVIELCLL